MSRKIVFITLSIFPTYMFLTQLLSSSSSQRFFSGHWSHINRSHRSRTDIRQLCGSVSIIRIPSSSVFSDSRSFFGFIFNLGNVAVQIISLGFVRNNALTASAQESVTGHSCLSAGGSHPLGWGHGNRAEHNGRGRGWISGRVNSGWRDGG